MSDTAPALPPRLPERAPRRRAPWLIAAAVVVVAIVVIVIVFATRPSSGSSASPTASTAKPQTVTIGVSDGSQSYWKLFEADAKKKLNVTVKLVNFSDYSQPNPALSQGQLDLNQFQHIQFLANYDVTNHDTLQPIGSTAVYPLPLYSLKYKTPADLPAGSQIAIANDAVNEARGLLTLQAAKLLTLKDGGTAFSTVNDITSAKVKVSALDASQTALALQNGSVAGAIVNVNYATQANLPRTDAIFNDNPKAASSAPYLNVFAAKKADIHNKTYLALVKIYQEPKIEAAVNKANGGVAVFRTLSPAALQTELKTVEAQARAAGAGK